MRKFVKELATNRFGIVMATLDLCYFFFIKNYFSDFFQNCREISALCDKDSFYLLNFYCAKLMTYVDSIAITASMSISSHHLFNDLFSLSYLQIQAFPFIFLVGFQWLFIGWIAKKIAHKIRSN